VQTPVALVHLTDSRPDFLERRTPLLQQELSRLEWLRQATPLIESGLVNTPQAAIEFAAEALRRGAHAVIVHLPIWADPLLSVHLLTAAPLPALLLGNRRPETSSLVGLLGNGGALDQVGIPHERVFDHAQPEGRESVTAFLQAAGARQRLRGQTLGLFGGASLGILTAVADPAQVLRLFGVSIQPVDQMEIAERARSMPAAVVEAHAGWLRRRLGGLEFSGDFGEAGFERQVRSYLATRQLATDYGFDFVGVKCQRELSDGYATQCVAHMLANATQDADGEKPGLVHACESDVDGALTMRILSLIAGGRSAALLDIRWLDPENGLWTLANCGALPADLFATDADPSGLASVRGVPHVFGHGGGGAYPGMVPPQPVTLARLCRRRGEYWMAILRGEVLPADPATAARTTAAFPQAIVHAASGDDFLQAYGSNHIHLVAGDVVQALIMFCRMVGIPHRLWAD
jgi:L-fucose isomerase